MQDLLPADALAGTRIGISISESPDLARLGLLETHFRLALGEIARCVLISGGNLAYGGHLDPAGYTTLLASELQRYGRRDRPLLVCLAWTEHRRISLSELERRKLDLGLLGTIVCLDPDGKEVDPGASRGEEPEPVDEPGLAARSLTGLREYMTHRTQARVLIGGKRHNFSGALPGLLEEAMLAVEARQPLYLAAGFGGVTADIARALGVDQFEWLPPRPDALPDDPRLVEGVGRLSAITRSPEWAGIQTGLSSEENSRLAATHRPSDIAALVGLGLGRIRTRQ